MYEPMESKAVLLVEDNADDAFFVRLVFRKIGVECALFVVSDGQQAIDYLKGSGQYSDRNQFPVPAIVLLDLWMPRMNGFEVLTWLRQESGLNHLPVTVLTGSVHKDHRQRACELGANSFLEKPFKFEDLDKTLRQFVGFWLQCCQLPQMQN